MTTDSCFSSDAVAAAVALPLTETSSGTASSQCKLFAAGAEMFWVVKAKVAPAATRTAFVVNQCVCNSVQGTKTHTQGVDARLLDHAPADIEAKAFTRVALVVPQSRRPWHHMMRQCSGLKHKKMQSLL